MPKEIRVAGERATSPMLAALRAGTRECHRAVERELALPRRIGSRADLADTLAALLASWQPLEHRLAECDWSDLGLDAHLGEGAGLLRVDLATLDEQPDPTAPATAAAIRLDTLAQAVGARYVLLGSAMGGRIIAPTIERRLGTPYGWATGFFRRDGMDPDRDWHTFGTAVAGHHWSADELDQAVCCARDTFGFIGRTASSVLAERVSG